MLLQVILTKTFKNYMVGNLHTLQPSNATHSNLIKRKAYTCSLQDVQKDNQKAKITKKKCPFNWRVLNSVLFIQLHATTGMNLI